MSIEGTIIGVVVALIVVSATLACVVILVMIAEWRRQGEAAYPCETCHDTGYIDAAGTRVCPTRCEAALIVERKWADRLVNQ